MNKEEATRLAVEAVKDPERERSTGHHLVLAGVQRSNIADEWNVLFDIKSLADPGSVIDGPVVMCVNADGEVYSLGESLARMRSDYADWEPRDGSMPDF